MNPLHKDTGEHLYGKTQDIGPICRAMRRMQASAVMMDARLRLLTAEPERGAATAEYAVVLIAATGFAALLVGIIKSGAVKTLLTELVKKALSLG